MTSPTAMSGEGSVPNKGTQDSVDDDIPLFFGSFGGADTNAAGEGSSNEDRSPSSNKNGTGDNNVAVDDEIPVFFGSISFGAEGNTDAGENMSGNTGAISKASEASSETDPSSSPQRQAVGYAAALLKGSTSPSSKKV